MRLRAVGRRAGGLAVSILYRALHDFFLLHEQYSAGTHIGHRSRTCWLQQRT